MSYLKIYDTTLRDGAQNPFVRFTTEGKLEATHVLDELGVDYIEGGFPQAGGHCDYFSKVKDTTEAKIAAFGMTPRTYDFDNDPSMKALLDTDADVITLVVKTPEPQIRRVLGKSPRVYRAIAGDAIRYLKSLGKEVVVDAEHFFDEYKRSPGSAMALLDECGDADWLVLCDTNGGAMYRDVSGVVRDVIREVGDRVGVHFHNDRGLALANTLKAAYAGARHLQVTMNGMGERTGNANLVEVVGNLYDKGFGIEAEPHKLTDASRSMEKLSGWSMTPNAPFVGRLAFSHSGGMHSDAMLKWQKSYEHAEPGTFGNERAFPISGQSGRAAITMKLSQWGYDMDKNHPVVRGLLDDIGGMGYVGDAQFYLMFSRYDSSYHDPIEIESMRVTDNICLLYTSPSPRDLSTSRMPSSA